MADDIGGPGFLGTLGSIAGGIGSLLTGFFAISARQLLKLITYLRDKVVSITQDALKGLHQLGRALAKAIRSLDQQTGDGVEPALLNLDGRIKTIKDWLTGKFAPILAWILRIKDEFDKIYKKWIRPILDTINFISLINRALTALHITVLQGLDDALEKVRHYIDSTVNEIRGRLTQAQNIIDRIVTIDGLFQRITLITSMQRYAPDWIKTFWNRQLGARRKPEPPLPPGEDPLEVKPEIYGEWLADVWQGEHSPITAYIGELVPIWNEAAGLVTQSPPNQST